MSQLLIRPFNTLPGEVSTVSTRRTSERPRDRGRNTVCTHGGGSGHSWWAAAHLCRSATGYTRTSQPLLASRLKHFPKLVKTACTTQTMTRHEAVDPVLSASLTLTYILLLCGSRLPTAVHNLKPSTPSSVIGHAVKPGRC